MARQKALPGDAPVKRIRWKDLPSQDKLTVLYWIKESMDRGVKKMVLGAAYRQFATAVGRGQEFNPAQVWNALPERTTDHFHHSRIFMDEIDEQIDEIEAELDDEDAGDDDPERLGPEIHLEGFGVQRDDGEEGGDDGPY